MDDPERIEHLVRTAIVSVEGMLRRRADGQDDVAAFLRALAADVCERTERFLRER